MPGRKDVVKQYQLEGIGKEILKLKLQMSIMEGMITEIQGKISSERSED